MVPLPAKNAFYGLVDLVALVAIHALTITELRRLTVAGVDLARGALAVPRNGRSHLVYLDEVTLALLLRFLPERCELGCPH